MPETVSTLLAILGVVVIVAAAVMTIYLIGFRTQNPRFLHIVRRINRSFTNRAPLRVAGTPGAEVGLLRHRGRTSGREYVVPIGPVATPGGFDILLPYGPRVDWLRNIEATGSAVLVFDGRTYRVDRPEVLPVESTDFAARRAVRLLGVRTALRLRAAELADEELTAPRGPGLDE